MSDFSTEQVSYKLGQIEAKIEGGFDSLKERMDTFCKTTDDLEGRLTNVEAFNNKVMAGLAIVGFVVSPLMALVVKLL